MRNVKLRYYLRGLGIGVLVTAVVMSVALQGEEQTLTDAQIRERALEIGMVDGKSLVLSDLQNDSSVKSDSLEETEEQLTEEVTSSEEILSTEEIQATEDVSSTEEMLPTDEEPSTEDVQEPTEGMQEPAEGQEDLEQPVIEEEQQQDTLVADGTDSQSRVSGEINVEGDTVTIEIRAGAHSYGVSKVLAQMGLVADANAYDKFLCDNGYSKKIHTGRYLIAVGTSEEEIAKIITGNR